MFTGRRSWPLSILIAGVALVALACGSAAAPENAPGTAELPETSASALTQYLQSQDYQNTWELWPGKGERYAGAEPHGMLLTTYLNPVALEALNSKAGTMPHGSIIIKENYTPAGELDAVTTMFKVSGYNPEHNDWFWTKVGADGAVQAEGQVEGCQACHGAKKDNDYVWTGPLQ